MSPHSAARNAPDPARIHPALRRFGDESGDALVQLLAYVGVLAILAAAATLAATHHTTLFDASETELALRPGFVPTLGSPPSAAPATAENGASAAQNPRLRGSL
uniref:Uncharacterized protein n=1 Tax=Rhodopseudomonas palustris (strain BisA53) TaxID=316055 RepID=Q07UE2_RHOP5